MDTWEREFEDAVTDKELDDLAESILSECEDEMILHATTSFDN